MKIKIQELIAGPVIKGGKNKSDSSEIFIWGKADFMRDRSCVKDEDYICRIIARCKPIDHVLDTYVKTVDTIVYPENDYTGTIEFRDIVHDVIYEYEIGYYFYYPSKDNNDQIDLLWPKNITRGTFKKTILDFESADAGKSSWKFGFGSHKNKKSIFSIFDTKTYKIYQSIRQNDPDFFLFVKNKYCAGSLKNIKTAKQNYEKFIAHPDVKQLFSNIPIYESCNNYDLQISRNSINSYWYWFTHKNATFFVADTNDANIINNAQLSAIHKWLYDPVNSDKIKFFVSAIPVVSQNIEKSFFSNPDTQVKLLNLLTDSIVKNVYILTSHPSCARIGVYKIFINGEESVKEITEIMTPNLFSNEYDFGKEFSENMINDFDETVYNKKNSFPYRVDSIHGNFSFVTKFSSKCFPKVQKNILYSDNNINVFTIINIFEYYMSICVYDNNGQLLNRDILAF